MSCKVSSRCEMCAWSPSLYFARFRWITRVHQTYLCCDTPGTLSEQLQALSVEWFRRAGGCRVLPTSSWNCCERVWMVTVNPLLSEISGEEELPWGIFGEYGYSIVVLYHIVYFLPFFYSYGYLHKNTSFISLESSAPAAFALLEAQISP